MPYTQEELARLMQPPDLSSSVEPLGIPFKTGKQLLNIAPKAVNSLLSGVVGAVGSVRPDLDVTELQRDAGEALPSFDVGKNEGIKDTILNDVAPEIASWMIPYLGATKAVKAVGIGGRVGAALAEGIGQGAANFVSGSKENGEEATRTGALGLASGAVQELLPRWQRILPLAGIGAVDMLAGGSLAEAGINLAGNLLPGAFNNVTKPTLKVEPIKAPFVHPEYQSQLHPGELKFVDELPVPIERGSLLPREPAAPYDPSLPFVVQPSDHLSITSAAELNGLKLNREPVQLDLKFPEPAEPVVSLKLGRQPEPIPPLDPVEIPSGLRLKPEGNFPEELDPLLTLQSQRQAPINPHIGPEPAPIVLHDNTPSLLDWKRPEGVEPTPVLADTKPGAFPLKPAEQLQLDHPKIAQPEVITGPAKGSLKDLDEVAQGMKIVANNVKEDIKASQENIGKFTQNLVDETVGSVKMGDLGDPFEEGFAPYRKSMAEFEAKNAAQQEAWRLERIAEGRPRPSDLPEPKAFTTEIKEAIGHAPKEAFFGQKLYISRVHEAWEKSTGKTMSLEQFKGKLLQEARQGKVGLSRMDFPRLPDERGLEYDKSLLPSQIRDGDDLFHFVTTEKGYQPKPPSPVEPSTLADAKIDPAMDYMQGIKKNIVSNILALPKIGKRASQNSGLLDIHVNKLKPIKTEVLQTAYRKGLSKEQSLAFWEEVKAAAIEQATTKGKGFKANLKPDAGAIDPETLVILGVGGAAAVAAYTETKGDVGATVAVTLAALGLGLAGAKALNKLKTHTGPTVKPLAKTVIPGESVKAKFIQFAKDTAKTPAGFAVMGRGGIWANSVLMAEHLTGLNASELFRDSKIKADGFISDQLEILSKAWDNVKAITPTNAGSEASARYLRGQLGGKVETDALLSVGGLDSSAYHKLDTAGKGHYPDKWIVMDDPKNTNTKGPGVAVYHVTNSTKKALLKLQDDALETLMTTPQDKEFMAFTKQARGTIDNLMQVVHAGLPPGKRLDTVLGTMGQYAARTHEIFTNPAYYPDDVSIQKAMDRIAIIKEGRFFDQAAASVSPSVGTVPVTYGGNTYHITPAQKVQFDNLHTPESLRLLVTQYIKEAKQIGAAKGKGLISKDTEQIGSSLFSSRSELDAVTQTLLGTHTAPLNLIQQTVNKLIPSAKAAHFMQDLIVMLDRATGLPMAFKTEGEFNQAINKLKADMTNPAISPVDLQHAKNQYQELSSYIPVSGQDPKMGLFQGAYVSRGAHAQLAGFNNPFGILDNAIGQGLSKFNNLIKETHLVLNPIVHVRNLIQIPMFLAMGGAGAHPSIWKTAFEALRDPTSAMGRKLVQNGATSGNPVHGELNHSLKEMLDGSSDTKIWAAFKKAKNFSRDLYAFPDDFVRASTFLAAEERAAKKFGVSVLDNDPRVLQEARLHMSRRTMDYANVPAWVKAGRQVPMVSMFLSYTHEIMRVSANMAVDAFHGDLAAGATLAGLSTLPFMLQSMAENELAPADLKDWNQAQKVGQDYSRTRFKLPLSRNKDGTFNYVDITPLSPINDFQMAARAIAKGDTGALIANNPFVGLEKTPLLSVMSEQITGKETHTGKEFRDGWDRARSLAAAIVPPMTPGIGNEYKKTFPESMGGTLGITNVKTGRTNTGIGALLRNTLGVDYTQVNASIATKNFIRSAQHDIANEKQYLLDVERQQGLSQDAKERARERFVAAVKHITDTLESRLK